ncbi:hypothetical protein AURDEDRAFT_169262 [Auricularia subglabra TFB-10046 SS5]|nr:hypothetical protein AURDEDRAFT_169262 [Auricularia subglabra TFB-10046 SS5]
MAGLIDNAVKESSEELSQRPLDPLAHLPVELATACFRLLNFRGRFRVSHVSRAWRRAALADCCMWNTLRLDEERPDQLDMLETLLARSGDVPFNFAWDTARAIPDDLLAMLLPHMGRMGKLICSKASARLLQHSAPSLRELALRNVVVALPADWTHSVPRLEVLKLHVFSIPHDFQALPALTCLKGSLAEGSSQPVLSRVFPRLVTLELNGVTQDTVRALGAPPPSCQSVRLESKAPVDFSLFVQACHRHRVPYMLFSRATSIAASVQEFAHSTRGKCSMLIQNESCIVLECKEDDVVRILDGALKSPFVAEVGGFMYLDRLYELSLPLEFLLRICALQSHAATFPALHILRLEAAQSDIARIHQLLRGPVSPLSMPALEELVLEAQRLDYACDERAYYRSYNALSRAPARWLVAELPTQLPALLATGRLPLLRTLTVVLFSMDNAEHFARTQDLDALRTLAHTLTVSDQSVLFRSDSEDSDEAIAAAVRSTVEMVVAQFLEARNERYTDPLMRLPLELAASCFRQLDFHCRMAASQVSRAWRRLGGCELLVMMLARSGCLPFEFAWKSPEAMPEALLEVVLQNMYRMASFTCWISWNVTDADLCAEWSSQLQALELDLLRIPSGTFQPLSVLTSLEAHLHGGSSIPVLSRDFPRLVTLRLGGITKRAVQSLGPPPPSRRLPWLSVSGASSISPFVQELMHSTQGKCRMHVSYRSKLTLLCKEDGVAREVCAAKSRSFPILQESSCFLYVDRLHELSLNLDLLLRIYKLQPAGPTFPALRSLILLVGPRDDSVLQELAASNGIPLRMPRLEELALDTPTLDYYDGGDMHMLSTELPRLLPTIISSSKEQLYFETLTVVPPFKANVAHFSARPGLDSLRGLAGTLRVVDQPTFYHYSAK